MHSNESIFLPSGRNFEELYLPYFFVCFLVEDESSSSSDSYSELLLEELELTSSSDDETGVGDLCRCL